MTMYVGTVASYAIELWSSASPNNPIGDATRLITLQVSVPSGSPGAPSFGVLLMFVPSGRDVPGPSKLAASPPDVVELTFYLYTSMDDYSDVLDLLRTVSVIGFNIDDDNASTERGGGKSRARGHLAGGNFSLNRIPQPTSVGPILATYSAFTRIVP